MEKCTLNLDNYGIVVEFQQRNESPEDETMMQFIVLPCCLLQNKVFVNVVFSVI